MENKHFKKLFNEIATKRNFERAFGGWFRNSTECIVTLDLQKSNFENQYLLNIKIYIQGMLGVFYTKNKYLVKKDVGDIFLRQPKEYSDTLNLDISFSEDVRREKLEALFNDFIIPVTNQALSISGIMELSQQGVIFLLPAVRDELKLNN